MCRSSLLEGNVFSLQPFSETTQNISHSDWAACSAGESQVSTFSDTLACGAFYMFSFQAMDISADLHELTRCPVGLVSAGVKSILDIGRSENTINT